MNKLGHLSGITSHILDLAVCLLLQVAQGLAQSRCSFNITNPSGSPKGFRPRPPRVGESAPPWPAIIGDYCLSIRREAVADWLRESSWAGRQPQSLRRGLCPGRGEGVAAASAHARCVRRAGGGGSHGGSVREVGAAQPPGLGVVSEAISPALVHSD